MRITGGGRLVGLDVARCLALIGMVATHVLDERSPGGGLAPMQWLAGGRASALFAVLAGVSLALMTGRREPTRGRQRAHRSLGLAVRALVIAMIGLALGELRSGIAVILTYYGVLFLLGLPFLGLRARTLGVLAGVWMLVAPVLSHLLRPGLPERGTESPTLGQLADPWQLGSELLFTGYYPAVPWLAYLLAGLALGRADLRSPRLLGVLAVGGAAVAVVTTAVSAALTGPQLRESVESGMYGTTPTDSWRMLLLVAPHTGTPFDLGQTTGSAVAVVAGCLLASHGLPAAVRRGVAVFFGAGTMTLTLYSLHVVMRSPWVWPPEEPDTFRWHVLVLLGVGAGFAAAQRRGPLEWLAARLSRAPGGSRLSGSRLSG